MRPGLALARATRREEAGGRGREGRRGPDDPGISRRQSTQQRPSRGGSSAAAGRSQLFHDKPSPGPFESRRPLEQKVDESVGRARVRRNGFYLYAPVRENKIKMFVHSRGSVCVCVCARDGRVCGRRICDIVKGAS